MRTVSKVIWKINLRLAEIERRQAVEGGWLQRLVPEREGDTPSPVAGRPNGETVPGRRQRPAQEGCPR